MPLPEFRREAGRWAHPSVTVLQPEKLTGISGDARGRGLGDGSLWAADSSSPAPTPIPSLAQESLCVWGCGGRGGCHSRIIKPDCPSVAWRSGLGVGTSSHGNRNLPGLGASKPHPLRTPSTGERFLSHCAFAPLTPPEAPACFPVSLGGPFLPFLQASGSISSSGSHPPPPGWVRSSPPCSAMCSSQVHIRVTLA